jgi:hypothetical protein
MRSISSIAAFALTMVVCAEVTPINSGMSQVISLHTRSFRGEVHEASFRRRRTVDGIKNAAIDSTPKEPFGGENQAPPSRKRKSARSGEEASSTENGSGATSNRDQPSPRTRKKRQRQIGQVDVNHHYNPARYHANLPTSFRDSGTLRMTSKKSNIHDSQPSMVTFPTFRRQNPKVDLNHDSASSKMLSLSTDSIGTWSLSSKQSSSSTGSIGT